MRNAFKILQRMVDVLATSIWIARLPVSQQCQITRARQILQEQADVLLARIDEPNLREGASTSCGWHSLPPLKPSSPMQASPSGEGPAASGPVAFGEDRRCLDADKAILSREAG